MMSPLPHSPTVTRRATVDGLLCALAAVGALAVTLDARRTTVDLVELAVVEAPSQAASLRINPNAASWVELSALPGLGEVLSKRIVSYRQQRRQELNDPAAKVFRSAEDLKAVRGIGPKRSQTLARHMTFGRTTAGTQDASH